MSFRTETDAARTFRDGISRVLHCVSARVFVASGKPNALRLRAIVVNGTRPMRLVNSVPLTLRVAVECRTVAVTEGCADTNYRVCVCLGGCTDDTRIVRVSLASGNRNSVAFPHLHIGPASGKLRDEYARAHMDTGHIALPTMLHLIIRDFAVDPVRIDWLSVLTQTRAFWDTAVSYEE